MFRFLSLSHVCCSNCCTCTCLIGGLRSLSRRHFLYSRKLVVFTADEEKNKKISIYLSYRLRHACVQTIVPKNFQEEYLVKLLPFRQSENQKHYCQYESSFFKRRFIIIIIMMIIILLIKSLLHVKSLFT